MTHRPALMLGLALRLLLAAACVLPFTGVSAAAAFLAPTPGSTAPVVPVGEEDEREKDEAAKGAAAQERQARATRPGYRPLRPVPRPVSGPTSGPSRPTAADPFRNGLGTPFRC
jgi:hypothetical protein